MASRLSRKVAEALASYHGERPEVRTAFESGLISAVGCLRSVVDEITKPTRTELLEAVALIFAEGYIGGSWAKVHAALESAPEVYRHVKDLIPNARHHPLAL